MKNYKSWLVFIIPKANAGHSFFLMQETLFYSKTSNKIAYLGF